ncbi:MAG TPA: phosphate ABC transporter substrate-binding protein [Myxococcales bacterium]|jgi:phosphate transport system substrate-binding protein
MRAPLLTAACLLALLCGAGCRRDPPPKETLLIAGNAALARYLEPLVKEFVARNPNASVVVEPGGSTAAVIALKRGAIDVAALSRLVGAEEDDAYLHDYQVCRDGLAIIVHPANPVTTLSRQQLDEIFSGEILNWKQVGGADLPFAPYVREKTSRSSRSFNELVLGGDEPFSGAKAVASSKEMLEHVAQEPGAIGFMTLRRQSKGAKDGSKDPEVATIKVEGVEMSRATMLSGRYPLSRAFYLAVYMKPPKMAEEFVQFVLGKSGQEILAKDGMLPVH